MAAEARELVEEPFGRTQLHCIGRMYGTQADIYLGGLLEVGSTAISYHAHA